MRVPKVMKSCGKTAFQDARPQAATELRQLSGPKGSEVHFVRKFTSECLKSDDFNRENDFRDPRCSYSCAGPLV